MNKEEYIQYHQEFLGSAIKDVIYHASHLPSQSRKLILEGLIKLLEGLKSAED